MRRRPGLTNKRQRVFLDFYAANGNIAKSAEAAGITRQAHYVWMKQEKYATEFLAAEEEAADALEHEARRRAVDGVDEPVFHRGEICGHIRRYSDTLLIFMLKGARPEKYKDNALVENRINVISDDFAARLEAELDGKPYRKLNVNARDDERQDDGNDTPG